MATYCVLRLAIVLGLVIASPWTGKLAGDRLQKAGRQLLQRRIAVPAH